MSEFKVIGKNVTRVDAMEKVTGQALYAGDLKMPGMLYGKIVRCLQHAHAKVVRLDFSEAEKIKGVVKIVGPDDVTKKTYNTSALDAATGEKLKHAFGEQCDQNIFTKYVRHQGDAICGVIAKTEEIAERAAAKIIVEYDVLDIVMTPSEATAEGAPVLHSTKPGNFAFQLPGVMFKDNTMGWGDANSAMAEADIIVEDKFYLNKQKQCQMEPHAYVAKYDLRGRLNVYTSAQMPKLAHQQLSTLFEMPMSRVKINQTIVGGGFGCRLGLVAEPETCAMALAVPGRPVKVTTLREEDWIISESRHPGDYWMKLGFKKDGTPVACEATFKANTGAYYSHASGVPFTTGCWIAGMYKFENLAYKGEAYFTNQVASGAYRGYGNPQTNFVLEQLIDRACNELNIEPLAWRKKWHKGVGDTSWHPAHIYHSCQMDACLDQGADAINWHEKRDVYANQTGSKRRGIGMSVMNHCTSATGMILEHTFCTVMLHEDGTAVVNIGASDLGQGSHTVLQQIAAEKLGFAMDDIFMKTGDSDSNGFDIGAHASRTTFVAGNAIISACEDVNQQLLERAAVALETPAEELGKENKEFFVKSDPSRRKSIQSISYEGVIQPIDPMTGQAMGVEGQILGKASNHSKVNAPTFGVSFVDLEVDTETGEVTLHDMVMVQDIGRTLHPRMARGQMIGGGQHGLGMALTEETYYDENGLCVNNSFTDYKQLGASDMPNTKVIFVEDPDPNSPYGGKGIGEGSLVTPLGAVSNAIYNALGIQFLKAPITPEKVLKAINEQGLTFN